MNLDMSTMEQCIRCIYNTLHVHHKHISQLTVQHSHDGPHYIKIAWLHQPFFKYQYEANISINNSMKVPLYCTKCSDISLFI